MLIHGYEFLLKVEPNPEHNSITFRILFPPIEVKINDHMVHLGKPVEAQKFALQKANEMLKKNSVREITLSNGDEMNYIEEDIIADGFQEKKIKENGYVTIPLKNCQGSLLKFT